MALNLCFFNKKCIAKRDEANAQAQQAITQQQQVLMDIANKPSGGLKTGAIVAIIGGVLLISGFIFYRIKKRGKV